MIRTLVKEKKITLSNGDTVPVVPVLTCDLKVRKYDYGNQQKLTLPLDISAHVRSLRDLSAYIVLEVPLL